MASDSDRKPFLGDTATRGSQTEPQINEGPDGIPVMTAANTSMVTRSNENKKRPWGGQTASKVEAPRQGIPYFDSQPIAKKAAHYPILQLGIQSRSVTTDTKGIRFVGICLYAPA